MKKQTRIHPLLFLIPLILLGPVYSFLNQSTEGAYPITVPLDDSIPFIKEFIIPYVVWYPFIYSALIYLCFKERKLYFVALSSLIAGKIIAFIVYATWQTTVPRPEVTGNDVFSQLVRFIYSNDQPVNCFPSIHVMTTFIIMLVAIKRIKKTPWLSIGALTIGVLIILSTLFTKQHALLDVLSGLGLGAVMYTISYALWSMAWNRVSLPFTSVRERAGEIRK
ncbi:phosphatase PAP2 family protein [Bacillus testis]|uniref:phosphatase PAP2 family protein n=1 Tax=Bacillus testis TaxID=1622072 RepID=UPI00067F732F|nr:phosphatase PAP2 family protein [Bacillus testis]